MSKYIKILFILFFSMNFHTIHAKSIQDTQMEQAILKYVNEYRLQKHLQPLVLNNAVSKEAFLHSQDMAQHKLSFGHDGFYQRIKRCFQALNKNSGPGAENVAYNYKTAKIVVDGWLHSPGHLANIRGNYNLTGIGIAYDNKGKIYFTQIFMRA